MSKKRSSCRPALPSRAGKKSGLTLVEILVVLFVFTIVVGALYLSLNTGQSSSAYASARADLQAKVRNIMTLIVSDVRQTTLVELNNNTPSVGHIEFRKVTGIDASGGYEYDTDYIEYTYDDVQETLTRTVYVSGAPGTPTQETTWDDIDELTFYADSSTPLAADDILASKKIIITVKGKTTVMGSQIDFQLVEEVKIRNE